MTADQVATKINRIGRQEVPIGCNPYGQRIGAMLKSNGDLCFAGRQPDESWSKKARAIVTEIRAT
jgi:hypothetical protein